MVDLHCSLQLNISSNALLLISIARGIVFLFFLFFGVYLKMYSNSLF